jgi:hypothetical protein
MHSHWLIVHMSSYLMVHIIPFPIIVPFTEYKYDLIYFLPFIMLHYVSSLHCLGPQTNFVFSHFSSLP